MKKKLIATVMAATMAVTALTGCGSSSASSAKKDIKVPTKPFGDTVKYDPSVEINDGKITGQSFLWHSMVRTDRHSSMYITAIMRILSTIWLRLIFLLRIWSRTSME